MRPKRYSLGKFSHRYNLCTTICLKNGQYLGVTTISRNIGLMQFWPSSEWLKLRNTLFLLVHKVEWFERLVLSWEFSIASQYCTKRYLMIFLTNIYVGQNFLTKFFDQKLLFCQVIFSILFLTKNILDQ